MADRGHFKAPRRETWEVVGLVIAAVAVLAITGVLDDQHNHDARAVDVAAHNVVQQGRPYVDPDTADEFDVQVVEVDGELVINRPPGLILWAVPFYAIAQPDGPAVWPGRVAAVTAASLIVLILYFVLRPRFGHRTALVSAGAFLVATATWPMSGRILLPHPPGQLALAVFLLGLSRERLWLTGLAGAAAILVRPPLALVPVVAAVYLAWRRRSSRPLLLVGAGTSVGLILLVAYNYAVFGLLNLRGGYADVYTENLIAQSPGRHWTHLMTLVELLVSPQHGIFVWTPVLLLLLPGVRSAWRSAPDWVKAAAFGGVAYFIVRARLNADAGGGLAFNYRYQLETLTLLVPLLVGCYFAWVTDRRIRMQLFAVALGASVALQATNVFATTCVDTGHGARCGLWFSVAERSDPAQGL